MRPSNRFRSYIKFYRNLRVVGISASVVLAAFMTLAAYPIVRVAQTAEALTGNPASTILTITSASPSANVDLVPRSSNGTFSSSSDTESAKFSILTDNYTGYKLLIAGSDNTGLLTNTDTTITTNNTLSSITTAIDAGVFGGDSATAFNGKWGYQPSKYYNPTSHTVVDNTNFLPSPTLDAPDTLDETTIANTKKPTATSDTLDCTNYDCNEYTIALGARADYNVVPGTYTNTFVLTAIANKIPFTINFNDNTEDSTVANLPATISDDTTSTSVALPTTIPTRTGYTFAGWCDTVTTINSNGSTTCTNPTTGQTGMVYPASTATTTSYLDFIDQTASSNIANLYAMWSIESYTITITNSNTTSGANSLTIPFNGSTTVTVTPASGYYLSAVSCPTGYTCTGYNTGSSYTGEQTVTVTNNGTAAGGTLGFTGTLSCTPQSGTMQNFTPNTGSNYCESGTLTDNRDNQTYMVAKLADGNWWMLDSLSLGSATLAQSLSTSNTNMSSSTAFTLPEPSQTGSSFSSYTAPKIYTAEADVVTSSYGNTTPRGLGSGKSGVFYNYCAASAGTICTDTNSSNAQYDICPKGWRMPTGGSGGEYEALYLAYNSNNTDFRAALSTPLAGLLYDGRFAFKNSSGNFWASTGNSGDAYGMNHLTTRTNTDADPVSVVISSRRERGMNIRCVLKVPAMQDFTATDAVAMTTGESRILKDSRDGQKYTVAKLPDGKVWMTKNLAIGCNGNNRVDASLSSANSNVSSYTINTSTVGNLTADTSGSYTEAYMQCSKTYGAWYNYMAATAGTISGSSNSTNATSDICPSGWRLPTYAEQQAITSYTTAFSPVTGGFYNGGSLGNTGYGYWWSSTAFYDIARYVLRYDGSSMDTSGLNRYFGLYVRCVLKAPAMQDFTASDAAAMATGETKTLRDSRDEQDYTVAKLPDGKVWMTQNLNLAGGTTLTSSTSNVTSNYTLPASSTSGFSSDSTAYVYNSGSTSCGNNSPCYSYYSYRAACAGQNPSSGTCSQDICPKGWRLPTQAEFNTLTSSYSTGSALTGSPFLAVYGGYYANSSFYNGGSYGNYWSSAANKSAGTFGLGFVSSGAGVDLYTRRRGFSVRCVKSS